MDDLVDTLNKYHLIEEGWEITAIQERAMREMCHALSWNIPQTFNLQPVNSPACLIHWRILMALLQNLSPNSREDLKRSFPGTAMLEATVACEETEPLPQSEPESEVEPAPTRFSFSP